ncbi:MgtC/SapB family protein [Tumebacillus permanentifrigoris]|uniref:Putative Mg2+ transporter-C (MgtC) family protein n=1 Tax=Tumebacillus permanentifrigoris TaxID=378543 RepID=A0A316D9D9_9BACL|nr:MgtC/SapB family protein [Tumebacillus permanentifrigoris]PWK13788.1 putative Mg2+ transporter-C (MgtC) family protein [Tumebacillus permanentifrigoris]
MTAIWQDLLKELSVIDIVAVRLIIAFIAGAIMGMERERNLKASNVGSATGAGFRTYSLVCLGSCMYALASEFGFPATGPTMDPGRVAAQVVAGVGFLGAGTIIKDKSGFVRGLTTAAGLWVAAAIGLMIGAGMYLSGILSSLLVFVILDAHHLFPRMFRRWGSAETGLNDEEQDNAEKRKDNQQDEDRPEKHEGQGVS